jgi:hypothetical protein
MTLWLKSWDQVPAGTLPNDNIDLCRLAELGRDMKAWTKIRKGAMRGWIKCADGRLHHRVVAEGVMEAWARRDAAKRKGRAGAAKRWTEQGKDGSPTASAAGPPDPSAEAPATTGTVPANIAEALSENSPGIVAAIDETVSDDRIDRDRDIVQPRFARLTPRRRCPSASQETKVRQRST